MSPNVRALILLVLIIIIPIATWLVLPTLPSLGQPAEIFSGGTTYPASPVKFERATVGAKPVGLPLITNVQILDFDG
ncbi:MAG TPA: VCBS repeat-containing protein, partial [Planctomycetaceae bacterium]|nr:VCBS repeat-containing protein [Planctomycetaceae bacterium]